MEKQSAKNNIAKLIEKYQHLEKLEKLKNYNEAQTRNEFIEPFFEYLGWDMRNVNNENEVTTEENVARDRVDLAFRLSGIPAMYVEAKSLRTDLNIEQYSRQAINYAWNKGVAYAVLTDFESIKLYNADAESKRLIDKLIFEIPFTDYISDFDRIWLLAKDSFLQGALDEYAQKYGKMKKRLKVNEKLFRDLKEIREILTTAFGQWNEKISKDLLEEGVQRIIDRLVFIRVLEDRRLEPSLLKEVLREWQKNTGQQFFSLLTHKFRELDDLYDSNIFQKHACDEWEEYSQDFRKVIELLYGKDEIYTYDFREIPADILGGVYESYLGYISQNRESKDIEGDKKEIEQKVQRKRKQQGIFYTPQYIVNYLAEQTLGKKLEECNTMLDLKKLRVLDPACGSASFLVKALTAINDKYKEFGNPGNQYTKSEILLTNIYGVDLDSQAVELAKLNLLIETLDQKAKLPDITPHIREGNSLVSGEMETLKKYFGEKWREQKPFDFKDEFKEVFKQEGFDVIIGNPPYVFARGGSFAENVKKYYNENFSLAKYQLNTYILFIDRAFQLLKDGGYFGFIIPNNWLTLDSLSNLRKFLFERTSDLQIINIFGKIFKDANVDTCLLLFRKGKPNSITVGEFREGKLEIIGQFPVSFFNKDNYVINISLVKNKDKAVILDKIKRVSSQLSEHATVSTGLKAYQEGKGKPTQTKEMKEGRVFHSKKKKDETYKKYLEGRDVSRYYLGWSGECLSYGDWLAEPRKSVPFNGPRILVRQIPSPHPYSINAVYTDKEFLHDINSMVIFDIKSSAFYLLAVLNSKLTSFWFSNTFDKLQRQTFPQFRVKELSIFPIPKANTSEQKKIAGMVQQMIDLHKELKKISPNSNRYDNVKREIEKLDDEIDGEIYDLYGFTEAEKKIIEQ